MRLICPNPGTWAEIHKLLVAEAKLIPDADPPPKALILAGWSFSSDTEKEIRWKSTIRWAENHNLTHLLIDIPENDMYYVKK